MARSFRLGLLAVLIAAAPAAGQPLREFAGDVAAVSGKSLAVENRMGDRRSFAGGGKTPVSGARTRWADLQKGDRVIVSWSLDDQPAKARRVRVTGTR
jgi:hypothetical protein